MRFTFWTFALFMKGSICLLLVLNSYSIFPSAAFFPMARLSKRAKKATSQLVKIKDGTYCTACCSASSIALREIYISFSLLTYRVSFHTGFQMVSLKLGERFQRLSVSALMRLTADRLKLDEVKHLISIGHPIISNCHRAVRS